MKVTLIVFMVILIILFGLPKLGIEVKIRDIYENKKIFFFIFCFVFLCVILYLNRYSILAFIFLQHNDYPLIFSIKKSLTMSNDITFFIGVLEEIANQQRIPIPIKLSNRLTELINQTYGELGSYADLLDLMKLVW